MSISKMKVLMPIIIAVFISTLSLLAYENQVLRGSVAILHRNLISMTESFENLENQHMRLLSEHELLLVTYQKLLEENTTLNESYNILKKEHSTLLDKYEKLVMDYIELTESYTKLNDSYTILLQNHVDLQGRYKVLSNMYQELQAIYVSLKEAYDKLYFAMYRPLWSNETVTPTMSELREWLEKDDTNRLPYSKWDFVCGDFAVMLSMHAKLKHWDMGIVAVIGKDAKGNAFNHAFNAIVCKEGLVYIEPQNDEIFHGPIRVGEWYYHPGFGAIYVEAFIIVVLYQQ
ncbi:MAG: hypothetical protein N3F04_01035 [Candidatus Nezhaarchaeota archaeon]|nr:hypothetical protein [Candidatus Nezhaarchaeota archaeon]MCX8141361.1 hypothetical protein [Candidatus Nezhaarchaeota archaeon]MDW8049627.1 hypothetical protein [Nitrososphaerota archaeon]